MEGICGLMRPSLRIMTVAEEAVEDVVVVEAAMEVVVAEAAVDVMIGEA